MNGKRTHTRINTRKREQSDGRWLHIAPTSTSIWTARNQLKSTFYFYDYSFLRTRAKFILFPYFLAHALAMALKLMHKYIRRYAHSFSHIHVWLQRDNAYLWLYPMHVPRYYKTHRTLLCACMVRTHTYTQKENKTPTVLLENSLPSIQIIPSPILARCLSNSRFIVSSFHRLFLYLCLPFLAHIFLSSIFFNSIMVVNRMCLLFVLQFHSWTGKCWLTHSHAHRRINRKSWWNAIEEINFWNIQSKSQLILAKYCLDIRILIFGIPCPGK